MPITSSAVKALDMYSNKIKIEFKRTILNTTFYKRSFCFFTFKGINVTIQRIGKSMFFEHFFVKINLKLPILYQIHSICVDFCHESALQKNNKSYSLNCYLVKNLTTHLRILYICSRK